MTEPLEIAEILRDVLEQSEQMSREAAALGEAGRRLREAVTVAGRRHLDGHDLVPLDLLLAAGAARDRCASTAELGEALRAALGELPLALRPEPPSPLVGRADAELRRRLAVG